MKQVLSEQTRQIQMRFFEAFETAVQLGMTSGLKPFCFRHCLNRPKYQIMKVELQRNVSSDKLRYKFIDIDALYYLCEDFGVSPEWLLTGRGKMMKPKN